MPDELEAEPRLAHMYNRPMHAGCGALLLPAERFFNVHAGRGIPLLPAATLLFNAHGGR